MEQTWVPDRRLYFDDDLEPILELFYDPLDETDRTKGYEVTIRNGPLRLIGKVVPKGRRWHAKPVGAAILADTFPTRKAAVIALIERRRRLTKGPDL
jgi:hypothetical protein